MRPRIAYPLAFLLVLVGLVVGIRYSIPGTVNGASLFLILAILAAVWVVVLARRDDEAPTEDGDLFVTGVYPAAKNRVVYSSQPPRPETLRNPIAGDMAYVVGGDYVVRERWVHTGTTWKRADF